jgi:hypothetical protein
LIADWEIQLSPINVASEAVLGLLAGHRTAGDCHRRAGVCRCRQPLRGPGVACQLDGLLEGADQDRGLGVVKQVKDLDSGAWTETGAIRF